MVVHLWFVFRASLVPACLSRNERSGMSDVSPTACDDFLRKATSPGPSICHMGAATTKRNVKGKGGAGAGLSRYLQTTRTICEISVLPYPCIEIG